MYNNLGYTENKALSNCKEIQQIIESDYNKMFLLRYNYENGLILFNVTNRSITNYSRTITIPYEKVAKNKQKTLTKIIELVKRFPTK